MDIARPSENTILVLFKQVISQDNFQHVTQFSEEINSTLSDYIIDCVTAYSSVHITFNLTKISGADFIQKLNKIDTELNTSETEKTPHKIINIPTYYGDEVALDIQHIAHHANLSTDAVIAIHSSIIYDVYAIGFAPGFAYLGTVDPRIASPRKETPRKKVAQGSVAIAGQQTAIYPSDSPGGWQIIGKTPLPLIDYNKNPMTPFSVGSKVKFSAIDRDEFLAWGGTI